MLLRVIIFYGRFSLLTFLELLYSFGLWVPSLTNAFKVIENYISTIIQQAKKKQKNEIFLHFLQQRKNDF